MELKDTVSMMESADYKERFKAEYNQLAIRFEKLNAMLDKADYLAALEARAVMEGVIL